MFISWLIGIGTGLVISGIFLSILLYKSNGLKVIDSVDSKTKITELPVPDSAVEEVKSVNPLEPIKEETIVLEIDETATARDIAALLESKGVIANKQEFLTYIISKKAARSLMHGSKSFQLNSDYETVFQILTTYP